MEVVDVPEVVVVATVYLELNPVFVEQQGSPSQAAVPPGTEEVVEEEVVVSAEEAEVDVISPIPYPAGVHDQISSAQDLEEVGAVAAAVVGEVAELSVGEVAVVAELTLALPVVLALVELLAVALALPVGLSADLHHPELEGAAVELPVVLALALPVGIFHHHPELEGAAGI